MIAILSGLIAGLVHVFSGPDHLSAVAPLSVVHRHQTWMTGFRWGIGHASGVLVVGLLALVFRELLPLDLLSSWAERLVGVMLIGIGIWGFRRALENQVHTHEHLHDERRHVHIHVHRRETIHPHSSTGQPHDHGHAALGVGMLHGLAGSSHFWGVLPALAFPTKTLAASYLLSYGAGTVVAMISFSSVIGLVADWLSFNGLKAYRTLLGFSSGSAVLVGSYWLLV
ncbi:MAG: nickel transporter [Verrucomicrobiales bacterium]|nr:nickel transporter [Verrucomicrobiales bacterium]